MKKQPTKEVHYGVKVFVNPTIESLRRTECLCLNCGEVANCPTAKKLYEICKQDNVAMAIARCPKWRNK